MSEEKPTFKITDRRLFNPDGTPRDIPREPEPTPTAEAGAAHESSVQTEQAASAPQPPADAATAQAVGSQESSARGPAEAEDSQEFLMIVEFIASFAAEALGMSAHPESGGQAHINPPLARQCIDMLGTLERKTRGNLNAEERQFLDLVLTQLRMQYVQLTRQRQGANPSGPPRGFTGNDITGGR